MKKIPLIALAVFILLIAGIAAFILLGKERSMPVDTEPTTFPTGGLIDPGTNEPLKTLVITDYDGAQMEVRDFRKTEDPFVPGQYVIAGGRDAESAPYDIFYQEMDNYFGITLYKEPLGEQRRLAEEELQRTLGITNDQMCRLNYVVAPGPGIAETYEGVNLGFSFCPGATVLP
jgi:hypothetical protein